MISCALTDSSWDGIMITSREQVSSPAIIVSKCAPVVNLLPRQEPGFHSRGTSHLEARTMEWRAIQEFPDYQVSDMGQVRSLKCGRTKILRQTVNTQGYLKVRLGNTNGYRTCRIHRLVLESFSERPPNSVLCRHLDGNKRNNQLDNLRWGTREENASDNVRLQECRRGSRHGMSKLTEADVVNIRRLYPAVKCRALAQQYGVDYCAIHKIVTNQAWKHVGDS
jgi:hypothetical protein